MVRVPRATLALSCLLIAAPHFGMAADAESIIELWRDGRVSLDLRARGAHKLEAQLRNKTDGALVARFEPGLVADAFAQNGALAQIAPGGGGQQGGQGLGFLETRDVPIASGEVVDLSFRTACLNFGISEPDHKSMLFLKTVEEYTANPAVHAVLAGIARQNVDTEVAQAALWHVTDRMSWDQLSRQGIQLGRYFTGAQLSLASRIVGQIERTTSGPAVAIAANVPIEAAAPKITLVVNPDPRGANEAVEWSLDVARRLQTHSVFAISHANYVPETKGPAWSVLIQAPRNPDRPVVVSLLPNGAGARSGRTNKPIVVRLPAGKHSAAEVCQSVYEQILGALSDRFVQVEWSRVGKDRSVSISNALPVALASVTLANSRDKTARVELSPVEIPAGAKVDLPLDAEQIRQLGSARDLSAFAFRQRP